MRKERLRDIKRGREAITRRARSRARGMLYALFVRLDVADLAAVGALALRAG